MVVRGDDFTFTGIDEELNKVEKLMGEWYDIKVRGRLGSSEWNEKEITILGRTLRWTKDGLEYEGDEKHRKEILKSWGLGDGTNDSKVWKVKVKEEDDVNSKEELDAGMAKQFRGMAARISYMGQDRSDVQFAAREICTEMAKPTIGGMMRTKKMARYLVGAERVVWKM